MYAIQTSSHFFADVSGLRAAHRAVGGRVTRQLPRRSHVASLVRRVVGGAPMARPGHDVGTRRFLVLAGNEHLLRRGHDVAVDSAATFVLAADFPRRTRRFFWHLLILRTRKREKSLRNAAVVAEIGWKRTKTRFTLSNEASSS